MLVADRHEGEEQSLCFCKYNWTRLRRSLIAIRLGAWLGEEFKRSAEPIKCAITGSALT